MMMRGQTSSQSLQRPPVDSMRVGRILWLAVILIGSVFIAIIIRDQATPLILGIFSLLAMIGVTALFFAAAGFLQFGARAVSSLPDITRQYAEHADHGIAVTSKDGSTVYSNAAYRQFVGASDVSPFSAESALVRQFGGSEPLFRLIRAARRGEAAQEEFQALGAPGAGRWFRASVRRVAMSKDRGGRDWVCLWDVSDITARVKQEKQLAQKLKNMRKLFDHLPVGIFLVRQNGNVSFVNATLRNWVDLADQEKEAPHKLSGIFPDQADALLAARPEAGKPQILSLDLVKRDGTALPISVMLARQTVGPDEDDTEIFGTVVERYTELDPHVLQNEIDTLFALMKLAPVAIAAITKDGRITASNIAFARFIGTGRRLKSDNLFELIDEVTGEKMRQSLEKAASRKVSIPPVEISTVEGQKTGRLLLSSLSQNIDTDETDSVALIFGVDTSEQRQLEEQIAQGQKMQAIGQLAGGIAHDFNNVLTAIIGFSDLLLANHRASDPAFADIMNIKNNANRAAGLVRHLLAFSRKQTLRPQVMSLTDALADLTVLLDQLLGEKVKANVVHGRDLWLVKVDPTQFQQVIINLAVNARDAMSDGGELTIRTANISERESAALGHKMMEPGEYVLCEVSDTGTGIPPDVIDKIFEPFFSTKEVGKGTGLGLSTVYGIVKQTGGFIFADSELGSGTIFRIYLPRCEERTIAPEASAEKPAKKEKEATRDLTGSATVLLVEDEDAVRSFAARALTTRGYRVLEAASGVQALDVMSEHGGDVDIVVSDVVMPEMDGPTLLKHLRKTNPQIKIIFVSGYAEDAFRNNLSEDETFTFLPKPFSLKKLAAAVKEVLEAD